MLWSIFANTDREGCETTKGINGMEQTEIYPWYHRLIKGRLESYIATGQDLAQVIKVTRTNMANCGMTRDMLAKMLDEIYAASVRPFLQVAVGSPWYQALRDERFRLLKTELL
jgi:hypothetical protein